MSQSFPQPPFAGQPVAPGQYGSPAASAPAPSGGKRAKKDKASKKSISLTRKATIGLGVTAGGLLLLAGCQNSGPSQYVAVLKAPVASFTTIAADQIEAVPVGEGAVLNGAFVGSDAASAINAAAAGAKDRLTRWPLGAHQQLSTDQFSATLAAAQPLSPTERLVSVRADVAASVGGSLRAGDHVDVVVATSGSSAATGVIVQDVVIVKTLSASEVLSSAAQQQNSEKGRDKSASELLPGDPIPGTYVLRVPDDAVLPLISSDAGGRLYLVLRGENAQALPSTTVSLEALLGR